MADPNAPLLDPAALLQWLTNPHAQTSPVNLGALQPQPRAVAPNLGLPAAAPPGTPATAPVDPNKPQDPGGKLSPLGAAAVLGPLTPVLLGGAHDPEWAANLLASSGISPAHLGFHSGAGDDTKTADSAGVGGTTVAPPTPEHQYAGTSPGGDTYANSTGVSGADGGSNLPAPTLRPQSAVAAGAPAGSTADISTTGGGIEGGDTRMSAGPSGGAAPSDPSKPFDFKALASVLGSLKAPAEHDPHFPSPPRVETSQHRFNPTDLLALVQGLSAPSSKAVPQSLGQLIGR